MEQTNNFISQNCVLFSQASCVLLGQLSNGCHVYVPVNVKQEEQEKARDNLRECIRLDEMSLGLYQDSNLPPDDPNGPSVA